MPAAPPAVESSPPRPLRWHLVATSGLLMGAADAVPGVSGGTIALVLGIYDRLLASLAAVVHPPWRWKRPDVVAAIGFLLPLLAGLLAALWLGTRLLVGPKDAPGLLLRPETAPLCFGFFFGLVVCSVPEPWRRIRDRRVGLVALFAAGAVGAFLFTGLPHVSRPPELWMLVPGGALALCVMLLPGVSGSMMLVILGQYATVTGAIHDRNLLPVGATALGVVLGIALFVPLLRRLLAARHDATMAVLTGMMAGSLRAVWPWKSGFDAAAGEIVNVAPKEPIAGVIVAALAGAACVFVLRLVEARVAGPAQPEEIPA